MSASIRATYLLETPIDPADAAEVLAGEQSSGTFVAVPGETEDLRTHHRARVETVEELDPVDVPSLPGALQPAGERYRTARVVVAYPFANVGVNLPTLVTTLLGNLFELKEVSGLKLLDVDLPPQFAEAYPGPGFGVEGTRRLTGVQDRPVIGTIVKPSVGLTPAQTAEIVTELVAAGIDFIKDDELTANSPHSPLQERVAAVMDVVNAHADRTGKKVMVAFNISDDLDEMYRHHDVVAEAGGTCVMLSLNSVGFAAVTAVRRHSRLPIHGHRNGWGMFGRHPRVGMDYVAYQKLWRLAGADHMHVNGLANKFWESDRSVIRSLKACLTPMFAERDVAMPVISSGQSAKQAVATYREAGTADLMYLAGGGIMAHPGGAAAGVRSLRQAWDAAVAGEDLRGRAQRDVELRQALETFGEPL